MLEFMLTCLLLILIYKCITAVSLQIDFYKLNLPKLNDADKLVENGTYASLENGHIIITTTDSKLIDEVLSKSFATFAEKTLAVFQKLRPGTYLNRLLITAKRETWQIHRSLYNSELFSLKYRQQNRSKLANLVARYVSQLQTTNVQCTLRYLVTETVCNVLLNEKLTAYELDSLVAGSSYLFDHFIHKEAKDILAIIHVSYPSLAFLVGPLRHMLMKLEAFSGVSKFGPGRETIQSLAKRTSKLRALNDVDRSEAIALLIEAGFESLTVTSHIILVLLALHEDVQLKVRQELLEADDENELRIDRSKYFDAVLSEMFRMYTPIFQLVPRIALKSFKYDNFTIPKNAKVRIPLRMQTSESNWSDADKFNPDRFYDFNQRKAVYSSRPNYLPFSKGPRDCIGKVFAIDVMKQFVSQVLMTYNVKIYEGDETVQITFEPSLLFSSLKEVPRLMFVKLNSDDLSEI